MISEKGKKKLSLIVAFLIGCAVAVLVTLFIFNGLLGYVKVSKSEYKEMENVYDKYAKLEELYQEVDENYYKEVDEDDLLTGTYKGLIEGLDDPYSSYMTEKEYESWKASATGSYSGIGITFMEDDEGRYVVVSVEKDSPAADAGLKAGDFITEVDGKEYNDMELMANDIRGEEGTSVEITYYRNGKEKTEKLTRREIEQESVSYEMIDDSTGYIEITGFLENTGDDFAEALDAVEKKGAKNLVLDLRDNGGGLMDSCIEVADEFLDEGVVTYLEDRNKSKTEYSAKDGKTDLKTVVLVNENSASASEILAAALQDNGIELVGKTTFGKGVVQSTSQLPDGSALKLTIMQYFSPKGRAVQDKGVTPDYKVSNPEKTSEDEQLDKALSLF